MIGTEWLNQNALRAYPIQEDMGRHPTVDGAAVEAEQLPNELLLDFYIVIPGTGGERVYLSKVVLAGTFISLEFSAVADGTLLASAAFDTASYTSGFAGIELTPRVTGVSGRVVVGNWDQVREIWPDGVYAFGADQAELEFCTVRSLPATLSGVVVDDGTNVSDMLTGIIKLVAGENVTLEYDVDHNAIIINAVPGAGYVKDCGECPVSDNVVKTINGIPLQDVVLASGNDCIEITTSGNTITITDKCSTPCCGCAELKLATEKLMAFDEHTTEVQNYRSRLEAAILLLEQALAQIPKVV